MSTCKFMTMRTAAVQPPPQHTSIPLSPTHIQPPVPGTHPTPYPQHTPNPLSPTLTQPPPLTHPTPSPTHTSVCTQEFDTKSRRIHSI